MATLAAGGRTNRPGASWIIKAGGQLVVSAFAMSRADRVNRRQVNNIKAQLGNPDMRLPIAVALSYPDRLPDAVPPTAFEAVGPLEFHRLDEERFPAVRLAREAALRRGGYPAVLNAANEAAVDSFQAGEIGFGEIV